MLNMFVPSNDMKQKPIIVFNFFFHYFKNKIKFIKAIEVNTNTPKKIIFMLNFFTRNYFYSAK